MSIADEVDTRLRNAVRDYLKARDIRDEAVLRMNELRDVLLRALDQGDTVELEPGVGVTLYAPNKQIMPELVAKFLSPHEIALISKTTIDTALLREQYPHLVESMTMSSGKPTIRVLS